jgi:hypothetical protein
MNIPSPAQVAANRTARLVREAQAPVYSTETPKAVHISAVELESDYGRHWSHMADTLVDGFITEMTALGYDLSDIDHSGKCWCFK